MNDLKVVNVSRRKLDNKALYREMNSSRLGSEIQPNAGRIQQAGKEAYCMAYFHSTSDEEHDSSERIYRICLESVSSAVVRHRFMPVVPLDPADRIRGRIYDDDNIVVYFSGWQLGSVKHIKPGKRSGDFLESASRLDRQGRIDAALDLIYDKIDALMTEGHFEEISTLLQNLHLKSLSVDLPLGLLTSTLPARTKIPCRGDFFRAVESEINRRGEWENGLLTGLES